jgi:hypothetical protein
MGDEKHRKITKKHPYLQEKYAFMQKKCKKIWSCQKKAVLLHPLLKRRLLVR